MTIKISKTNDKLLVVFLIGVCFGGIIFYTYLEVKEYITPEELRKMYSQKDVMNAMGDNHSDVAIQVTYTPNDILDAIDRGDVDYDRLSPFMKSLVDYIR